MYFSFGILRIDFCVWGRFHHHFLSCFFDNKLQSEIIPREKLRKTLLFKKRLEQNVDENDTRSQFHQQFTGSFCNCRLINRLQKDIDDLTFVLL